MPFFQPPALPHLPHLWPQAPAKIVRSHIGAWALKVETDRFSGRLTCSLGRSHITYERQTLVFQLSHHADTTAAAYRIDDGPPIWTNADTLELASLGFELHNDDLANPSGGLVRIPAHRLAGARLVSIEIKADTNPVRFRIDRFGDALDAAQKAGCTDADFR